MYNKLLIIISQKGTKTSVVLCTPKNVQNEIEHQVLVRVCVKQLEQYIVYKNVFWYYLLKLNFPKPCNKFSPKTSILKRRFNYL